MAVLKPSEVLAKAADLIEPEGAWTTRLFARDALGRSAGVFGPKAVCWCARGAMSKIADDYPLLARTQDFFARFLGEPEAPTVADHAAIAIWNDAPERTQAEVVAALRKASVLAAEAGQ